MTPTTRQIAPTPSTLCLVAEYPTAPGRSLAVIQHERGHFEAARIITGQNGKQTAYRIVAEKCRFDLLAEAQAFVSNIAAQIGEGA